MKIYNLSNQKVSLPKDLEDENLTIVFSSGNGDLQKFPEINFSKINILIKEENEHSFHHFFNLVYDKLPLEKELLEDVKYAKERFDVQNLEYIKSLVCGYLLESILHEFNNPITSISLNSQFLMEIVESDEEIDRQSFFKILNMMNSSILEASTIAKGFVSFSRMEHNEKDLFNLKDEVNLLTSFLLPYLRKKRIDLQRDFSDTLIYANRADLNLLLLLFFTTLSAIISEKSNISLTNDDEKIIINYPDNPVKSLIDLASYSYMQKNDFISTLGFILSKNGFSFEFTKDVIFIGFKKDVAES